MTIVTQFFILWSTAVLARSVKEQRYFLLQKTYRGI